MEKILLVPHPKLRQHAEIISKVTQKEVDISKKMIELLKNAPGVGLAANQIGILKKIVTVHIQDEEKKIQKTYALYNPKIKMDYHYSINPFTFKVKNPTQNTINQISTKNEISIEGRGKRNDSPLDGLDFSLAKIKLLKCQGKAKK